MADRAPRPRHRWFAAAYDRFIEPAGRERMHPLRRFAAGGARGRVLELGAGNGANLDYYDWQSVESLDVTEPDPFMVRRLRPHLEALPTDAQSRVRVHEAPAEQLPFPDDAFDCAVVTLVLCSVQDLDASLRELRRVVNPEGELRIVEHVRAEGAWHRVQDVIQPVYGWFSGACRLDRETEAAIQDAGFELTVTERLSFGATHPAFAGIARLGV